MKYRVIIRLALFFLLVSWKFSSNCQDLFEVDTAFLKYKTEAGDKYFEQISKLDPNRAALLSAILPGLGQAYNGQAWKIPIIYSGALIMGHFISYNHQYFHQFRNALIAEVDDRENTENPFNQVVVNAFNSNSLRINMDRFRRNRDYLAIIGGVMYLLNVAEAYIAAHLKEFEINDALSFKITPSFGHSPLFSRSTGISVRLTF